MAYNQRLESILTIVSRKRNVTVAELKERLGVSEVTIRKDLDVLEGEGIIVRTHGGAIMAEDRGTLRTIGMRVGSFDAEKEAIAAAAKRLIVEGETIYLDAGTTCRSLASHIGDMHLQIVTNSLDVMCDLAGAEGISVFSLGGSLRREARSFIGPAAVEALSNFQIHTCFLGTSGISEKGFFSSQNLIESQLKRAVLKSSRRRIVLADSSKYGVEAFSIFARPKDVELWITDSRFTHAEALSSLGIEVILAGVGNGSQKAGVIAET
jgi:DeoR/GlpR family transcriptional regulator of sugar metabolism